jgi:hypothetical protein
MIFVITIGPSATILERRIQMVDTLEQCQARIKIETDVLKSRLPMTQWVAKGECLQVIKSDTL